MADSIKVDHIEDEWDHISINPPTSIPHTSISCTSTLEVNKLNLLNDNTLTSVISIDSPAAFSSRSPIEIHAVVDTSSSMTGEPIEQVKHSLRFIISQLGEDDSLSITSFSNDSDLVLPLTKTDTTLKETIVRKINNIRAHGSTNLSSGLLQAIQQLSGLEGTSKIILLFTDGNMNMGITNNQNLLDAIQSQIGDKNVPIYSMGYGPSHNSELLTTLSGNGAYYFIDHIDTIPNTFGKCIGGLLSIVAQNVKISIDMNPSTTYTIDTVLTPFKFSGDDTSKVIKIGDLYAGETKNIPVIFKLPSYQLQIDPVNIYNVSIDWYDVQRKQFSTAIHTATITHSTDKCPKNQKVLIHKNRVAVSNAIRHANELATKYKLEEAKLHLEQLKIVLQLSPINTHKITTMLIQELNSCIDSMKSDDAYRSLGHNYMNTVSQGISLERQTTGQANCYMTPHQTKMERASSNYITGRTNIFDLSKNKLYPGALAPVKPSLIYPNKKPSTTIDYLLPNISIKRQHSI